jgi:hypothetical protein
MISNPLWLAAGVLLWTGVAWGGRIGLLTDGDGWSDLLRIGGSLLLGMVTPIALAVPSLRSRSAPLFYLFGIWTTGLWLRSMVVNWTGSGSLPFKLVHTILAAGFFWFRLCGLEGGAQQGRGHRGTIARGVRGMRL